MKERLDFDLFINSLDRDELNEEEMILLSSLGGWSVSGNNTGKCVNNCNGGNCVTGCGGN